MANKILILDDEEDIVEILSIYFAKIGAEIHPFTDATKAQEFLKGNEVDFIVVDFRMPQMSGLDFISSLDKKIPYLVLTGDLDIQAEDDDPNRLGVYRKPADLDLLPGVVEKKLKEG